MISKLEMRIYLWGKQEINIQPDKLEKTGIDICKIGLVENYDFSPKDIG